MFLINCFITLVSPIEFEESFHDQRLEFYNLNLIFPSKPLSSFKIIQIQKGNFEILRRMVPLIRRIKIRFDREMKHRPLLTQMATGGLLGTLGDILAQQLVEQRGFIDHDFVRTLRLGCFSFFVWSIIGKVILNA